MQERNFSERVTYALTIIGALNWGLVGLGKLVGADFDLVHRLLGWSPALERLVYLAVGVSAAVQITSNHDTSQRPRRTPHGDPGLEAPIDR